MSVVKSFGIVDALIFNGTGFFLQGHLMHDTCYFVLKHLSGEIFSNVLNI